MGLEKEALKNEVNDEREAIGDCSDAREISESRQKAEAPKGYRIRNIIRRPSDLVAFNRAEFQEGIGSKTRRCKIPLPAKADSPLSRTIRLRHGAAHIETSSMRCKAD